MKNYTLIGLIVMTLTGCIDYGPRSRATLEKSGFTDIQLTNESTWNECAKGEYGTSFRAKNPRGSIVEGVVCCGAQKSCTVRF